MQSVNQEIHKVLLIDDDESFCRVVDKMAKRAGIDLSYITQAKDIKQVEVLEDFDAIWVDYDLIETTGLEVAEYLDDRHPSIPVVLVSSTSRPFSDEMSLRKNIRGILSKWELTDEEISRDLIESSKGVFHSSRDVHPSSWQNNDEERIERLKDHFDIKVPVEKYRA